MEDDQPVVQSHNKIVTILVVIAIIAGVVLLVVFLIGLTVKPLSDTSSKNWTLASYADATGVLIPVMTPAEITARFGKNGNVTGFSGCNEYVAAYIIRGNRIAITRPITPGIFCTIPGSMEQERDFFSDLPQATFIEQSTAGIKILDTNKKVLLVFRPL